jgi:hypothetical protein
MCKVFFKIGNQTLVQVVIGWIEVFSVSPSQEYHHGIDLAGRTAWSHTKYLVKLLTSHG